MEELQRILTDAKRDRAEAAARARFLRRVPQRRVPVWEYALYALLPAALTVAGIMPTIAVAFLPAALVLLYLLYRRFGICLPSAVIAAYIGLSLGLNYDVLTVVYSCLIVFGFYGLVLSAQVSPYMLCAFIAAAACVLGTAIGTGIVSVAAQAPFNEVMGNYVVENADDPIVGFFTRDGYDHAELDEGETKLEPSDGGYAKAATEYYSGYVKKTLDGYMFYYSVSVGAVIGAIGYFFSLAVNRKTSASGDADATEETVGSSTRAIGGVRREKNRISDMRVPRLYLLVAALPAIIASIVLDLAGGFAAASATVMHTFVTLPSAFAAVTLVAYFAELFKGRGKIAARAVAGVLYAAVAVVPIVLFAVSIVGICDIILNLRYWTKFLASS